MAVAYPADLAVGKKFLPKGACCVHQLPITPEVWTDARFGDLAAQMRWSQAETLGVLVFLWARTRDWALGRMLTKEDVLTRIACPRGVREEAMQALADAGYLSGHAEGWVVVDNERYFTVSAKMREAGKQGGWHKHKKRKPAAKPAKLRAVKAPKTPSAASAAWEAYATAYTARYDVTPARNARVNGQMGQLVACLGADDATRLARWYVSHNDPFYLKTQHPVGLLLKNYSGLHTQMLRGQPITEHDVRAMSDSQRLKAQLQRFAAHAKG